MLSIPSSVHLQMVPVLNLMCYHDNTILVVEDCKMMKSLLVSVQHVLRRAHSAVVVTVPPPSIVVQSVLYSYIHRIHRHSDSMDHRHQFHPSSTLHSSYCVSIVVSMVAAAVDRPYLPLPSIYLLLKIVRIPFLLWMPKYLPWHFFSPRIV